MSETSEPRSPLATKNPNILKNNAMTIPRPSKLIQPSVMVRKRGQAAEPQSEIKPKKRMRTTERSKSPPAGRCVANSTASMMRRQTTVPTGRAAVTSSSMRRQTSARAIRSRGAVPPTGRQAPGATGAVSKASTKSAGGAPSGGLTNNKRKPWDYKGRMEDMEQYIKTNMSRINNLEMVNQTLEGTVEARTQQGQQASARVLDLEEKVKWYEDQLNKQQLTYDFELEVANRDKDSYQKERNQLKNRVEIAEEENTALKKTIAKMTADSMGITTELQATKVNLEKISADNLQKQEKINSQAIQIEQLNGTIADIEAKLRAEESVRRKLHNTVQELKGNIRVFCRVRPALDAEQGAALCNFSFAEKELAIESSTPNESITGRSKGAAHYDFAFDKVFQPSALQSQVFEEISQLVQSVLDGYNVCIFAYGQTGSGKTFTMEGDLSGDQQGMIPRAIEQVFQTAKDLKEKGWQYEMQASFMEIYNEAIRDLLGCDNSNLKHEIKLTSGSNGSGVNDVTVTNLTTMEVTSKSQVASLLEKASHNRAVAATQCNERSSRSHSVFRLKITGENAITEEKCQGTLNLIDLAGSERLSSSGSSGDRLKETKNINKSLSNLGKVIMALANKEQHIPYRNSKLTYLLQNSLGGNSKSLMFVNVSPKEESLQETLCSLRFATKVNQCNIGTAQKKVLAK